MADISNSRRLSRRAFLQRLSGSSASLSAGQESSGGGITYDTPIITHAGRFYVQSYRRTGGPPSIDRNTWTLAVGGLLEAPLLLTYEAVRALPAIGEMRTLLCMGNPPGGGWIGNAVWRGFDLDTVLAQAGILPEATRVRFDCADGYRTSVPLDRVIGQGVLMAYEMNGAVLPPEHGFPLRALVPGLYGCKSPKWLTGITLTDHDASGFWESAPRHWSDSAVVKTRAQITSPLPHSPVHVGEAVALQGIAFAGTRRITAVEVSVDGGDWMPVTLCPPDSRHAWTQWYVLWTPELPGDYAISVRATDEVGFTQSRLAGHLPDVYPDGSDSIHRILLRAVEGVPHRAKSDGDGLEVVSPVQSRGS
jgi:DMSO/TMAO reductase YedYZ molybdopterin-dependent catalytic subunit